jgi:hypothetical protein
MEEINLDGMFHDELNEIAIRFDQLALYARTKAKAMQQRSSGDIHDAIENEAVCEAIYKQLPQEFRW